MIDRLTQGKLTWVVLNRPTIKEIQEILTEYSVPLTFASDLSLQSNQSGVSCVDGYIKVTLSFPIVKRNDIKHPHELKFIIAKNVLITVQYEDMEATDRFKKSFEVQTTLNRTETKLTGAYLFILLMRELYAAMGSKLDYLESRLSEIEERVDQNEEKQVVFDISKLGKKMITFRHVIRTHDDVLEDLSVPFEKVYKKSFEEDIKNLLNSYGHILRRISALFEALNDLRETNFALLTTKQNEIMKILTIMAFVTFPLSLLTSTFGMNTESTPIVGGEWDFWIIVGIMVSATICFFGFFRYKHWL